MNSHSELLQYASKRDRDEDGYPDFPVVETAKCECGESCFLHELQAVSDGTETPLFLCPSCVAEFNAEEAGINCACDLPGRTYCEEHGAILREVRRVA